jgi:hypothetical protein
MTDIELSRRNLIGMTSAGVAAAALAGCSATGPQPESAVDQVDNFGDDPNGASALDRGPYNPEFMALVHITSASQWAINSNHAHFEFVQKTYDAAERTGRACKILLNKITGKLPRFRDAKPGSEFQAYDRNRGAGTPDYADYVEFANFGFGEPHDIYFFFEHAEGELSFDPKRLTGFSRTLLSGKKGDRNQAFYYAEIVGDAAVLGDLARLGTLIRLDNYCGIRDASGYHRLPFGDIKSQIYKLNIYYKARSGIAMAIDPDTGNGYGNGPRN